MSNRSFIISGPEENIPQNVTLGEYLIGCLRKRDSKDPLFIDAVSGKTQTVGGMLEDTIKAVHVLKSIGIKRDDVLAVISENDIKYCVPIMAAFCVGAITKLLNPAYSIGELRHALILSKPTIILCSSTAFNNIQILKKEFDFIKSILLVEPENGCTLNRSALYWNKLLSETGSVDYAGFAPESFDSAKQVALILLSSGTTGLPKAVLITHLNFRCSLTYAGDCRYMGQKANDRLASILPFFHIFGLITAFSTICLETEVIILQKMHRATYFKTIEKYNVNKLHVVPSILQIFANPINFEGYNLSSIEDILIAGAPLSNDDVAEVSKRLPGVNFREAYGSTEVSGAISFVNKFPKADNCVGSLIQNAIAKVWDSSSETTLGAMEVGELCFKGPMVMSKYLGIPNSSNIIDEDGFYHTGDLGYYDKDGLLYVVDRIKDLIKYKGFQVSPVEIERIIVLHPKVAECAVTGIPDKRSGQVPLAFVVPKSKCKVTEKEIIDFVAERISAQKHLYGGVQFVERLPKNASGKLLRRELNRLLTEDYTLHV